MWQLAPHLCALVPEAPPQLMGLVVDAAEAVVCGIPTCPWPRADAAVTAAKARRIVRSMLQEQLKDGSEERRLRASLLLGLVGERRALEPLGDELRTDRLGLALEAKHVLAAGPLAAEPAVVEWFVQASSPDVDVDRDRASFLVPSEDELEALAVCARSGSDVMQASGMRVLKAVRDTCYAGLESLLTGRAPTRQVLENMLRMLTLQSELGLLIEALTESTASHHRSVLADLLLVSRRDLRLRCAQALIRGGETGHLEWLKGYRDQEPCSLVRHMIPEQ